MRYTIEEVKACVRGAYRYWAGLLYIDYTAVRITWLLANYTRLTPNQVTFIHFFIRLGAFYAFCCGTKASLIVGAIFYQLSIILDDVDGKLARVKGMSSASGKYFDYMCDALGDFLCLSALVFIQMRNSQDGVWDVLGVTLPFLYLFVSYESQIFNETMAVSEAQGGKREQEGIDHEGDSSRQGFLNTILSKVKRFSRKAKISLVAVDMADVAILLFVVGPLFGVVQITLILSIVLMLERLIVGKALFFLRKNNGSAAGKGR